MSRCLECNVRIEGDWDSCPLCGASTIQQSGGAGPLPRIPLAFSRRRVLRTLVVVSVLLILAMLGVLALLRPQEPGIGAVRSVWLGVVTMWLLVITALARRRTISRLMLRLVVIVGALLAYWDWVTGWLGWSLTFAIPIVCGSAILGVLLILLLARRDAELHVVSGGIIVLIGFAPLLFLILGWVGTPWPSLICGALAVIVLLVLQILRGGALHAELSRRLHV